MRQIALVFIVCLSLFAFFGCNTSQTGQTPSLESKIAALEGRVATLEEEQAAVMGTLTHVKVDGKKYLNSQAPDKILGQSKGKVYSPSSLTGGTQSTTK